MNGIIELCAVHFFSLTITIVRAVYHAESVNNYFKIVQTIVLAKWFTPFPQIVYFPSSISYFPYLH